MYDGCGMTLSKIFKKKEYAENFVKGNIRFSSPESYRKSEKEKYPGRHDDYEGMFYWVKEGSGNIIIKNKEKVPIEKIPIGISNVKLYSEYGIFSMYTIMSDVKKQISIDKKISNLGEWVVILKDTQEFINRIDEYRELHPELQMRYEFANYDNNDYSDINEDHMFKKRKEYDYQQEFRIVIAPENEIGYPYAIKIKMEDICTMVTIKDLYDIRVEDEN